MNKIACLLGFLLIFNNALTGQCPVLSVFKTRFNEIYNIGTKSTDERLKQLLLLKTQMELCKSENDSLFTTLLQKLGVLYYLKSDFQNAVTYTEKAIQNASAGRIPFDSAIVQSYNNISFYYDALHETKKEYDAIDSCIMYAIKKNTGFQDACKAIINKTGHLFDIGDYGPCAISAALGEHFTENYYHASDSIVYITYFITFQANALYFSYKIPELVRFLKSKEAIFIKTHNTRYLGGIYSSLGRISKDKNDFETALSYFKKAYQANIAFKNREGISEDLNSMGIVYAKGFHLYEKGLGYCFQALKTARGPTDSLIVLDNIANIFSLKGDYDKAHYYFRQSFSTLGAGMDEVKLVNASLPVQGFNMYQDILDLITDKGNAYMRQYIATKNKTWSNAAIQVYRNGDLFLTKLKKEQGLQFVSNLVWRMDAHSLYEHAIETCYASGETEAAFYFFEKSRAVLLIDQMNALRSLSNFEMKKIARAEQQISQLEMELQTTDSSSGAYLDVLKKLYLASEARRALTNTLNQEKQTIPNHPTDSSFYTFQSVGNEFLQGNTHGLMEMFSGDTAIYLLTILQGNQSLQKINGGIYNRLSSEIMADISKAASFTRDEETFYATASELYQLLFGNTKIPDGRIIISPDGNFFPFEALVTGMTNGLPQYFFKHFATSYTYSVGFLHNARSDLQRSTTHIFGVAPVQFDSALHLADLRGSDISLSHINAYFNISKSLVQEEATKNNFLQNFPDYDIIQLYTHATDNNFLKDPVIYFADSALYLSQLVALRKPIAQLVVLSACETANGQVYQGEGVFSFNRSFAVFGIPAAISNLWSVDNQSTYLLTELFYKYLSRGMTTDVALQQAKLDFFSSSEKSKQFPYYWAATVLVGKCNAIAPDKKNHLLFIVLGILILGTVIFILFKKNSYASDKKI